MRQKIGNIVLLGVLALLMAVTFMGTTYTYTAPTAVASGASSSGASFQFIKLQHTFVATTDTAYFYFRINKPTLPADTVIWAGDVGTKGTDSTRCVWNYQYSYDGAAWNTYVIGTDSSATSAGIFSTRPVVIGMTVVGTVTTGVYAPPYNRVRAYGTTLAGGKSNKIGNVARLTLTKAS